MMSKGEMNMKKIFAGCGIVILIFTLLICALVIPRSNTRNAAVVISSDYSTISYKSEIYIPIQPEELPIEVMELSKTVATDMIKATVENENYFLDKFFFTNYISVKEFNGETFIYLHTDYDVNESDYYCSKAYKDSATTK